MYSYRGQNNEPRKCEKKQQALQEVCGRSAGGLPQETWSASWEPVADLVLEINGGIRPDVELSYLPRSWWAGVRKWDLSRWVDGKVPCLQNVRLVILWDLLRSVSGRAPKPPKPPGAVAQQRIIVGYNIAPTATCAYRSWTSETSFKSPCWRAWSVLAW
jgi:hypothetical protein